MSAHSGSVFNHSCLKVPVDPMSKMPSPSYEQKYFNQLENQALKMSLESSRNTTPKGTTAKRRSLETDSLKAYLDFYGSIPDYDQMNHLSNRDFYRHIESLKAKQKTYSKILEVAFEPEEKKATKWMGTYEEGGRTNAEERKSKYKPSLPCSKQWKDREKNISRSSIEVDSTSSGKETPIKPPSRRSVRIESPRMRNETDSNASTQEEKDIDDYRPKSRANLSSAGSKSANNKSVCSLADSTWDNLSETELAAKSEGIYESERETPLPETRSLPSSPVKTKHSVGWKDNGITIPKPFQMTIRDEEERIVDDILCSEKDRNKIRKSEMFRANPVPIESQIPLFDKIMEDQERRREIVKFKSKLNLISQMKPFTFTQRDEELQALSRRFSKSSPQLTYPESSMKIKQFKAKPVPKNLFSNYVYQKMYEDEFYRALKKKIRAEEMLKASSLPPSMAAREKRQIKNIVCPRSFEAFNLENFDLKKMKRTPNYNAGNDRLQLEFEDLKTDFISTSPSPFKFYTEKRGKKKSGRNCEKFSELMSNPRARSAMELQSVNRSNLAAVLRIQSARKRAEVEMCRRLEEQKLKEEMRWREKVMRKKPAWQALNYSNEEDLAMRLQLRKDEEKLRREEFLHQMEMMLGRVQRMPTLFERQSKLVYGDKSKKDYLMKLYEEYEKSSLTSDSKLHELRDEAVQVQIKLNDKEILSESTNEDKDQDDAEEGGSID